MIEKLLADFFTKVEEKELLKTKNAKANFLVEQLLEIEHNKPNYINTRTVIRLYDKFIDKKDNVSVSEPNEFLRNVMATYLGFENFQAYILAHKTEIETKENNSTTQTNKNKKGFRKEKKNVVIAFIAGSLTLGSIVFFKKPTKDCVIWQNDQFIEVNCKEYSNAIHKSKIAVDIEHFRQVHPTKDYVFFNNGNAVIFYGKNEKGTIEYFNRLTFHPETKKPLKPVTRYILNKEGFLDE